MSFQCGVYFKNQKQANILHDEQNKQKQKYT